MKYTLSAIAVALTVTFSPVAQAGPVILMGIDAEDGGVGGHGPIAVYQSVINSLLSGVTNGGTGMLVIGGGKSPTDDVTEFWTALTTGGTTSVNGAAAIAGASFAGYAAIAIVSDFNNTPSGGLTNAENGALSPRANDIAAFVNAGGGLLGFSSVGLTTPYGYLGNIGSFSFGSVFEDNITPTAAGSAVGITNALDICCWHDSYSTFPSFLNVLATYPDSGGQVAALGGLTVRLNPNQVPEPMTLGLLGAGLVGVAASRRRKIA